MEQSFHPTTAASGFLCMTLFHLFEWEAIPQFLVAGCARGRFALAFALSFVFAILFAFAPLIRKPYLFSRMAFARRLDNFYERTVVGNTLRPQASEA